MKFGPVPVSEAVGAFLAHAVALAGGTLRKGHLIEAVDVDGFRAAGHATVIVARLEAGDIAEDEAAGRIAAALAGDGIRAEAPATGRSNLFAAEAGVLLVDQAGILALNSIDPGITFATLPAFARAEDGRMVATVKIIPFAVPSEAVDRAIAGIRARGPLVRIARFSPKRVAVISTVLPSLKPSIIDKTLRVLTQRLRPTGASIVADRRVAHKEAAIAAAVSAARYDDHADLTIVFGASAVVDRADVIPAGIEAAGGQVRHFGMPVDPGNLLLVGEFDGAPVVGAPGCARSPKENGFDWILDRLLADIAVTPADIVGLGVGGLLMDIVSRPRPREAPKEAESPAARSIAALVLAAGRSSRMGGPNKLLALLNGKPLVVHAVEAALASRATSVTVVTGHMADAVEDILGGFDVRFAHNLNYAEGLSTSLRRGLAAIPSDAEAAIVLLGDMPRVTSAIVDRLIEAYEPARGQMIVVPTSEGRRGNPVLLSRRFFADLERVVGDLGARQVIGDYPEAVVEVEIGEAVGLDLDTPEALAAAGGTLAGG